MWLERACEVLYYGIKFIFIKKTFDGLKVKKHARYGVTENDHLF